MGFFNEASLAVDEEAKEGALIALLSDPSNFSNCYSSTSARSPRLPLSLPPSCSSALATRITLAMCK